MIMRISYLLSEISALIFMTAMAETDELRDFRESVEIIRKHYIGWSRNPVMLIVITFEMLQKPMFIANFS